MRADELLVKLWHQVPRPIQDAYRRVGFGFRPFVRRLLSDERRPVRISAGLPRGMFLNLHLRSERGLIAGDVELDVQLSLPTLVESGMCAYNVGANYGFFTLALARLVGPTGRVVAFEPNPPVVGRLRENVAVNHLAHVTVEPLAVSDEVGAMDFMLAGDFESHLVQRHRASAGESVIGVTTTTIDAYVRSGARAPDVVLMDVEESEGRALKGARETFRAYRPILVVEIHTGAAAHEVIEELAAIDYTLAELPSFRRVSAPGAVRPRGHYCAGPAAVLPAEHTAPETVAAALADIARAVAARAST